MHSLQEPNKIQNEVPQNFEKSMMPRDAVPRHHVMPRQFWSKLPHASFLQKRSIISKSGQEGNTEKGNEVGQGAYLTCLFILMADDERYGGVKTAPGDNYLLGKQE